MSDVMSRKQHSSTTFQEDWLVDESFKDWIRKIPDKPFKAYCVLCSKSFDIKTGRRSALKSHKGSATHDAIVKKQKKNSIGSYYESSNSSPSTKSSASPSSDASPHLPRRPLLCHLQAHPS